MMAFPSFTIPYRTRNRQIDRNFEAMQNKFHEYQQVIIGNDATVPLTGLHRAGEITFNAIPAVGEYVGWVCIEEGEPGTWRGFGIISSG